MCALMGISKLIVEIDCMLMVNLCNEDHPLNSRFRVLAWSFQSHFKECTIQHVMRELNVPAHLLTRHAWFMRDCQDYKGVKDDVVNAVIEINTSCSIS